jgi:hypothetical protein
MTAAALSPVVALFRQWNAQRKACDAAQEEELHQAAYKAMMQTEAAMFALPSHCPADLAMKLYAFTSGDVLLKCPHSQPLCAEIEALVGGPLQP